VSERVLPETKKSLVLPSSDSIGCAYMQCMRDKR
jgi:hypothetical protein